MNGAVGSRIEAHQNIQAQNLAAVGSRIEAQLSFWVQKVNAP